MLSIKLSIIKWINWTSLQLPSSKKTLYLLFHQYTSICGKSQSFIKFGEFINQFRPRVSRSRIASRSWIVLKSALFGYVLPSWFWKLPIWQFSLSIYFVILLGFISLPPSFSNLSKLVSLSLSNFNFQGFKKNSLFHFLNHYYLCKSDEEFPSCFQNMTKLTKLHLHQVRGSDPQPIPFPTKFCNMIYLRIFNSEYNKFSGLRR